MGYEQHKTSADQNRTEAALMEPPKVIRLSTDNTHEGIHTTQEKYSILINNLTGESDKNFERPLNKQQAKAVRANLNFFHPKVWTNWAAAAAISAGSIAPMLGAGWSISFVLFAVVSGILYWRELQFAPVRAEMAYNTSEENTSSTHDPFEALLLHLEALLLHLGLSLIGFTIAACISGLPALIVATIATFNLIAKPIQHLMSTRNEEQPEMIRSKAYKHFIEDLKAQALILTSEPDDVIKKSLLQLITKHVQQSDNPCNKAVCESWFKTLKETLPNNDQDETAKNLLEEALNELKQSAIDKFSAEAASHANANNIVSETDNLNYWLTIIAGITAWFGNFIGFFVAGLSLTGFVATQVFHLATLPPLVPWCVALTLGYAGVQCYRSNSGPNFKAQTKAFFEGKLIKKATTLRGKFSLYLGMIGSIVMGFSIGFFNLLQGRFFGYMLAHYTSVLSNPAILASLTCSETILGSILGWTGFVLVGTSLTMLFFKYFAPTVVALFEVDQANESEQDSDKKRQLFIGISSVTLVLGCCYRTVLLPLMAPLVNTITPYLYTAGSLAIIPTMSVITLVLIYLIHNRYTQPQDATTPQIAEFLVDICKVALISAVTFFTLNSVVGVVGLAIPASLTTLSAIAANAVTIFGTILYFCQVENVVQHSTKRVYGNYFGNHESWRAYHVSIGTRSPDDHILSANGGCCNKQPKP